VDARPTQEWRKMNWLFKLLFPKTDTTVRIKSGQLPGLKVPTIAPKIPHKVKPEETQASNIQWLYARYKATNPNKPARRSKEDRGVDF
jgi:hypothetical protein